VPTYLRWLDRRNRWAKQEQENIKALIRAEEAR
jgi:hypothetical protein